MVTKETKAHSQTATSYTSDVLASVLERNTAEPEFHQAVEEVFTSLGPVLERRSD